MDESALFWKMTPDGTLVLSKALEESTKKPKSPLILHAMLVDLTNLPWFIGKGCGTSLFGSVIKMAGRQVILLFDGF